MRNGINGSLPPACRQHRSRDAPVSAGGKQRPDVKEARTKRSRSRDARQDPSKPGSDMDGAQEIVRPLRSLHATVPLH